MYAALTNPALTISLEGFADGPGCKCDAAICLFQYVPCRIAKDLQSALLPYHAYPIWLWLF